MAEGDEIPPRNAVATKETTTTATAAPPRQRLLKWRNHSPVSHSPALLGTPENHPPLPPNIISRAAALNIQPCTDRGQISRVIYGCCLIFEFVPRQPVHGSHYYSPTYVFSAALASTSAA